MSHIGRWHYESDGANHNKTFYVWRYNDAERDGIERKDFGSKQNALRFLKEVEPRTHAIVTRPSNHDHHDEHLY